MTKFSDNDIKNTHLQSSLLCTYFKNYFGKERFMKYLIFTINLLTFFSIIHANDAILFEVADSAYETYDKNKYTIQVILPVKNVSLIANKKLVMQIKHQDSLGKEQFTPLELENLAFGIKDKEIIILITLGSLLQQFNSINLAKNPDAHQVKKYEIKGIFKKHGINWKLITKN